MSRVSDVARPNSVETTNLEHITQNIHALEQQRGSHSSRRVSGGIMSSKHAPTDPLRYERWRSRVRRGSCHARSAPHRTPRACEMTATFAPRCPHDIGGPLRRHGTHV